MTYSLIQEIEDIREFHQKGGEYFGKIMGQMASQLPLRGDPGLQDAVTRMVDTRSQSMISLMRKTIPIMLCSVWENFSVELKAQEPIRYQQHFSVYSKYHNEPIREISLLRNCIVHSQGKTDADYIKKSKLKTYTSTGVLIDFKDEDLDVYFETFKSAYEKIMI